MGVVNGAGVQRAIKQVVEDLYQVHPYHLPKLLEEYQAETVWSRCFVSTQLEGSLFDLFYRKRNRKRIRS